jgi:hypothetical protein
MALKSSEALATRGRPGGKPVPGDGRRREAGGDALSRGKVSMQIAVDASDRSSHNDVRAKRAIFRGRLVPSAAFTH